MSEERDEQILWRHLSSLPYFRAMVRAIEDSFYQGLELPSPVLDLGSGDGHFASVTFSQPLDVGVDPWWGPLRESQKYHAYRLLIQGDGGRLPFPSRSFSSVISNSVLEHIPHVDEVVNEISRILRPGGRFVFCVPNHRFPESVLGKHVLSRLGLPALADGYSRFFNRISRHYHCDSEEVWGQRLSSAGFVIEKSWNYFSPRALHKMEIGHALGLPSLFWKKIFGRWILLPKRWNLWFAYLIARGPFYSPYSLDGVYSFYITRKLD